MKLKLAVRLFVDGHLKEDNTVEVELEQFPKLLLDTGLHYADVLDGDLPALIELECLDEPDPNQRFFRFGTDSRGMVEPIPLDDAKRAACPDEETPAEREASPRIYIGEEFCSHGHVAAVVAVRALNEERARAILHNALNNQMATLRAEHPGQRPVCPFCGDPYEAYQRSVTLTDFRTMAEAHPHMSLRAAQLQRMWQNHQSHHTWLPDHQQRHGSPLMSIN